MTQKIYKILFIILCIIAIILLIFIIKKYGGRMENENKNQETLEVFSRIDENNTEKPKIQMEGYDVIGTVKIPKINIEYPIVAIETSNPEETKKPMKFAIVVIYTIPLATV